MRGGFNKRPREGNMERGRNSFAPAARDKVTEHVRPNQEGDTAFEGSIPLDKVEKLIGVSLHPKLMKQLKEKLEFTSLFPIQAQTLKAILAGKEILAKARTGSGKTLGFALPLIHTLLTTPRANRREPCFIILAPTRELALQSHRVCESLIPAGEPIVSIPVYGGHSASIQRQQLRNSQGMDIIVGTPGRMKDFIESNTLRMSSIKVAVLDEADRMLDEGFADDVEKILSSIPGKGFQLLLFSATIPDWVSGVVAKFGRDKKPEIIDLVGGNTITVSETVSFYELLTHSREEKQTIMGDLIRVYAGTTGRAIIFAQTKAECHELGMSPLLRVDVQTLHGDMTQEAREKTMQGFRDAKFNTLVATDVAARGLDIPRIDLVIQTTVPMDGDAFIHRAGRTGRAGRRGVCIVLRTRYDNFARLEYKCGIKFTSLTPPTKEDVMKSISKDVAVSIEKVDPAVTEWFKSASTGLLKGKSSEEINVIVANALALLSGYSKKEKGRSLIGNRLGAVTILYRCTDPRSTYFRRLSLMPVLEHIDEVMGPGARRACRHVTMGGNPGTGMYAVFDLDTADGDMLVNAFKSIPDISVEIIDELPKDYVAREQ